MGSSSTPSLECFDLTGNPNVLEPGTEEWKLMGRRIVEALETHSGVVVEFPSGEELFDETFSAARDLFELPLETKLKITESYPDYPTLLPNYDDPYPYHQSLGLMKPLNLEEVRAFTQVFWPHGNDTFSNTVNGISTKLHHVLQLILEMIFDSYGVRSHYESQIRNAEHHYTMGKYSGYAESSVALNPHFDSNFITALYPCTDGLQHMSKQGEWIPVKTPRKGSLVIQVGQALEGWSNGRLTACLHRVVMTDDNDRFSCAFFLGPKPDQVIAAPEELVDSQHPRIFKPFSHKELMEHNEANIAYANSLHMLAGI